MARLKPRAMGVNLLPKAKFPQAQNRFPVQIKPAAPGAPKPAAGLDPSLDQVLGKYT
jgi:hypothetical protein